MEKITNRKIRKPLMERKRRARINQSLDELQKFLTTTDSTLRSAKLEKADILEMTVQFLRNTQATDSSREVRDNIENLMQEYYLLGFEKCFQEINRLLEKIPNLVANLPKHMSHLKNCLEKYKHQSTKLVVIKSNKITDRFKDNILLGNQVLNSSKTRMCYAPVAETKQLQIHQSKLTHGNVIVLISSDINRCNSKEGKVWRPW